MAKKSDDRKTQEIEVPTGSETSETTAPASAETVKEKKSGAPTLTDHAKAAYELFIDRLDTTEAEFPAWDNLTSSERVGFLVGAQHVAEGNEARTDYERVVAEVMNA